MTEQGAQFAIQAAIRQAISRSHEYVTVEHLLYALLFDNSSAEVIQRCGGDVEGIRSELDAYLNAKIPELPDVEEEQDPKQTIGFRRVLERAVMQVQSSDRVRIRSKDILVAVFDETESYAVYLLGMQGINRVKIVEQISHGVTGTSAEVGDEAGGARSQSHSRSSRSTSRIWRSRETWIP